MRNPFAYVRKRAPFTNRVPRATSCTGLPFTPPPPAYTVAPLARVARPYVLHAERLRAARLVDRTRTGLEVLFEISRMEVMAA